MIPLRLLALLVALPAAAQEPPVEITIQPVGGAPTDVYRITAPGIPPMEVFVEDEQTIALALPECTARTLIVIDALDPFFGDGELPCLPPPRRFESWMEGDYLAVMSGPRAGEVPYAAALGPALAAIGSGDDSDFFDQVAAWQGNDAPDELAAGDALRQDLALASVREALAAGDLAAASDYAAEAAELVAASGDAATAAALRLLALDTAFRAGGQNPSSARGPLVAFAGDAPALTKSGSAAYAALAAAPLDVASIAVIPDPGGFERRMVAQQEPAPMAVAIEDDVQTAAASDSRAQEMDTAEAPAWTAEREAIFADIADQQIDTLVGRMVADATGEVLGEVDGVALSADVPVAIVGIGGFLGLGERAVALPLEDLDWTGEGFELRAATDLEALPEFDGTFIDEATTLREIYAPPQAASR